MRVAFVPRSAEIQPFVLEICYIHTTYYNLNYKQINNLFGLVHQLLPPNSFFLILYFYIMIHFIM